MHNGGVATMWSFARTTDSNLQRKGNDMDSFNWTTQLRKRVDRIKKLAMERYERGGDVIIETMTDEEIATEFTSVRDATGFMRDYFEVREERRGW